MHRVTECGFWCRVPAAGRGRRVGGGKAKRSLPLAGRLLLEHTLWRLAAHPRIVGLVVALAVDDPHWAGVRLPDTLPLLTAVGGAERADSVLAALRALPDTVGADAFVLVHDAARPCVRADDISRLLDRAANGDGGLLGAPLYDTLKQADADSRSLGTLARQACWRAFTPQLFRRGALTAALQAAAAARVTVTDEAMAVERMGLRPLLVAGAEDNIKITTPADLAAAESMLERIV